MFDFRHAVCADVDSLSIPLSLRRLLGLFACRLGCGGTVFSSRRAGCVAMSCLPIGPSRLSPRLSSRRSGRLVSSLAPFLDTMGGETGDCGWLSFSVSISCCLPRSPCACLPRGVSRHPSDADGGGGLRSVVSAGGLLACPVVSVPCRPFRFAARSFHLMARSIGAALCRPPMLLVWVRWGGVSCSCRASSHTHRLSAAS